MALCVNKKDEKDLRIHENAADLKLSLAEYIADLSQAAVNEHRVFNIALSGGSVISMMGKLCESPYTKTVDWNRWQIFWADERMVSKSHVDSNYKLAKDGLLSKVPVLSSQVHSFNDSLTSEQAAEAYTFVIRQLVKTRAIIPSEINDSPKFDLVLLEMGDDGHIASLFPNHPVLNEKDEWVAFMTNSPKAPPERITFTLPVINSAANVAILATGGDKANATHLVIDDIGPECPVLPARMVQPVEGKLVWFLDKAAASKLECAKFSE